jgi:hypothetical protein
MTRETRVIIVYTIIMAFLNIFFPLMYASNWYHFFDPMRNGFMPYVAFQAGYPVLGFIPYGLLALSCPSLLVYGYIMRYVNLALLSISLLVIYKVVEIHRGRRDALFTLLAVTLSVSIIAANPYSNDVIALFFSSLALFFLMKKSSALCGFSTGLAVLAKLYPVILLPLSLAFFKEWKERLSLLISLVLSVLLVDLPFLVLNPYMWSETFIGGNAGRGPWETVWAFINGYYSHGGVESMHPYFEGFFTYAQLKQIYPLSRVDHAFYLYSNNSTPLAMNLLLLLSFIVPLIVFKREKILELMGLSIALFLLASKGYSPEFTIFTLPLLALSVPYKDKFVITSLLDGATVLQMMNWSGWFAPFGQGVFLPYAVILRTAVLILAVIVCFNHITVGLSIRRVIMTNVRSFLNNSARSLRVFFTSRKMIKRAVPLFALILVFSSLFYTTYGSYKGKLASYDQPLKINTTENNVTRLNMTHDLEERTYIVINESLHAAVIADDCYVDYSNVNNTTRIFLVPHHEGFTVVYINLARANFSIDEVLINGDVEEAKGFAEFFQGENSSLIINATNSDPQRYYELYLSWPANFTINESTTISANLTHVNGYLHSVRLDLVNETGSFYHSELISNDSTSGRVWQPVINSTSIDMYDKNLTFSDCFGWRVSAMNLVMTLDHNKSATVKLDALSYCTDGGETQLPITLQDSVNCTAKVYVGEVFNLKNLPVGILTWCTPIIAALYAYRLVRRVKIENINDK